MIPFIPADQEVEKPLAENISEAPMSHKTGHSDKKKQQIPIEGQISFDDD